MLKHEKFYEMYAPYNSSETMARIESQRALLAQEIEPCLRAFASCPYYDETTRYEALKPLSWELLFELHRIYRNYNSDLAWVFYGLFDDEVERYAYYATIAHCGATISDLYRHCEKYVLTPHDHTILRHPYDISGQIDFYAYQLAFLSVFEKLA